MRSPLTDAPRVLATRRAATLALPLAAVAVRLFGLKRAYPLIGRVFRRRRRDGRTSLAEAEAIARAVVEANQRRLPIHAACLARALVAWAALRTHGYDADLRIGARTWTGRFEAHAWVELDGVALAEDEDVRHVYAAFPMRPEHLGLRAG